jgi:hypothetical protein
MDTDQYSLSNSFVSVGGAGMIPQSVDEFARTWVGGHYLISFALLIFLVIVILWLVIWKNKEGFNPTQTLRDQDSDQFGLSGRREHLDGGDRGQSAFAQQVQTSGGSTITGTQSPANQPGSLAWNVLHNSDFNCANRQPAEEDAWTWMNNVAREKLSNNKPKTDNDFSKVLAGH